MKSIKMDIMDTGLEDGRWMELADDRDKRQVWVIGAGALVPSSTLVSYKLSLTNGMKKK